MRRLNEHPMKLRFRNLVMRLGGDQIASLWWRLRGRPSEHLRGSLEERFSHIYANKFWNNGDERQPLSGPGSSLEATASIRSALPEFLKSVHAESLLDVGCGDYTWMQRIELSCPYIGIDVVPAVIERNHIQYGDAHHSFLALNACEQELPKADVVLCREVLFHLSFRDMRRLLANVRKTGARYFIATTDPHISVNVDIASGDHRERNLVIAPLKLGDPVAALSDDGLIESRVLGVWKL